MLSGEGVRSRLLTLRRRTGSNSASNQGLRVSQALLRHEGCGSGSTGYGALRVADACASRASSPADSCPRPRRDGSAAHRCRSPAPARIAAAPRTRSGCQSRAHSLSRRQVGALLVLPGKAEAHRDDGDAILVVEFLRGHAHPVAQAVAGGIGEGNAGGVHARARRLAAHGEPSLAADPQHRARLMRQRLASGVSAQWRQARMLASRRSRSELVAGALIDPASCRLARGDSARHRHYRGSSAWPRPYASAARAWRSGGHDWR